VIAKGYVLHLPQSFQGYEAYEQVLDIMQGPPQTFWLIFKTSARFWGFSTLLNPPDAAEHHDFLGFMVAM
jgi:hypothetical protein